MKPRSLFLAILMGCVTAATFNALGWLQISERKLYDFYLRLRPQESPEQKIVIVGLNEQDIEKYGFPLEDNTLVTLLDKIKAQNPRVIGLDLHRNVNIGTQNNESLNSIFRSTPQLIGVEKTDGGNPNFKSISPPTELAKRGQTGASEIIEDGESGVVRRGYLYVQKSTVEKVLPSFVLAMALKYLEEENIFPTGYGKQNWLKLGKAIFPMLQPNRLFYDNQAIDNYQTLINYRSSSQIPQVSVFQVLENKIIDNFLEDKIVIIGTTAETIKDIYTTPKDYDLVNFNFSYGVEIHGSLTSQIINSAISDRVIIKFIPVYLQYVGLLVLLAITVLTTWYLYCQKHFLMLRKTIIPIIISLISIATIFMAGYVFVLWGWWFPTVTSLIIVLSSQASIYLFIKLEQLQQANKILAEKVKARTLALEEAQQKILFYEKQALYQKLTRYIAHEIKNKTNIMGLTIQNSQTDLAELRAIVEDNAFLFEEMIMNETRLPSEIIADLHRKLLRMQQIESKITSIINEIYDRNKKDSNVTTAIDINHLIERLLVDAGQIYRIKYNNAQLVIESQYDENLPQIDCVISDLERALENIISNTLYYLGKKSSKSQNYQPILSVSTQNKSNAIEIKIKDNGTGIPAANLDKIFTMFWTTKSSGESMGIGLHFAKQLIEKNNGTISVNSVEEEYTEFIVILHSGNLRKS